MLSPLFRSPISFGDAQSAVVSQPGSPHHQAIKSSGKNPGETSLLRHNSKKRAAGTGRGPPAPGLFLLGCVLALPERPPGAELCRRSPAAGGKGDVQERLLHPAGFSRRPKGPDSTGWFCFGVGFCCSRVGFLRVQSLCGEIGVLGNVGTTPGPGRSGIRGS